MLTRLKGSRRFLVIGRAGMDFYTDPAGTRTSEAAHFFACLGGSSGNIAVALARHGLETELVTAVSDDAIGWFVLNELKRYNVGAKAVRKLKGEARTSLAVIESRVEDHQSVIYRNNAADFHMDKSDVAGLDYASFDALITTGTTLAAEPSVSATFEALQQARAKGLPVMFDIDYRPYSWTSAEHAAETYTRAASLCDVVIGNDDEFGVMAGGYDKGLAFAEQLAAGNEKIVVYKMGENGSITFHKGTATRVGVFKVTALKPTGAGDSFMGTFIASLAKGLTLEDAVTHGSAAAAIVVGRIGCAPAMPNETELRQFIDEHPGISQPQ